MSETVTYTDVLKNDSGFSFTGNMARFSRHEPMVDGYRALIDDTVLKNDFTSTWESIKVSSEEAGNEIYSKIRHYIDEIGNIDVCGLPALLNYAKILSCDGSLISGRTFPKEIQSLIEIFSINSAYLYNKVTDGSDSTLSLSNTILSHTTIEKFLQSFKNVDSYRRMIRDVFYNTLMNFMQLKVGTFDDVKVLNADQMIWKTDINRFKNRLWEEDIVSEESIYKLKESLGVSKSFSEKIYTDDIISGKRKLSDFTDIEQSVLLAELESRQSRYGNAPQMRYYFMRLYKVIEYFRFVTLINSTSHDIERYDISELKFTVNDSNKLRNIIISQYDNFIIDTEVVYKVSETLTDYCMDILSLRNKLKTQCQRNMMCGTKKIITDLIREFILENIDKNVWNKFKNNLLYSADLNKNFSVDVVEYIDNTEYYNIENPTDAVSKSEAGLNSRYWEIDSKSSNALSHDDILAFYNRLSDDARIFNCNDSDTTDSSTNLYEFLSAIFECGATSNVSSDLNAVSDDNVLTESSKEVFRKFSGDKDVGDTPWLNIKNSFHPSYQIHPFIQGFEEYTSAYTGIMNLVNSFSDDISTSIARIDERLDNIGNTINFWYNWNEDFTGYSTNFEKGGSDADIKLNQDSPFNFDALTEFIRLPDEFILNILNDINEYYLDSSTHKPILNDSEKRIEISRLKKFKSAIESLANKEIYKYSKDMYGNIYILYKDAGNRDNRNYLGEVWVRLKNRPIAFPLFDLTNSPEVFSQLSCLSESNNQKLNEVLQFIIHHFNETYGYTKDSNRFVVSNNLSITFGVCEKSGFLTKDKNGNAVHPDLEPSSLDDFKFNDITLKAAECPNESITSFLVGCYTHYKDTVIDLTKIEDYVELQSYSDIINSISTTEYFVDTITNEPIFSMVSISKYDAATDTYTILDGGNTTGQSIKAPSKEYFRAEYKGNTLKIRPSNITQNYIPFAEYDDEVESDVNTLYFYTNENGVKHPCVRHVIKLHKVYAMSADKLTGTVAADGTTTFNTLINNTLSTEPVTATTTVDGAAVSEDFDSYTYKFFNPVTQSTSGYKYNPEKTEEKKIVLIGGNNPFYVFDEVDENGDKTEIQLLEAERVVDRSPDTFKFVDDELYREVILDGDAGIIKQRYPFDDCTFTVPVDAEDLFDTTTQFFKKDTPYKFYYPYTNISTPTRNKNSLSLENPHGEVFFTKADGSKDKFYYNILPVADNGVNTHIYSKTILSRMFKDVLTSKLVRFNGGFTFLSDVENEYPIELTFSNSDTQMNVANYSTIYGENDYTKFFDMGFSYDQKRMYLAYRNGNDDFEHSGMIIGDVSEKIDDKFVHHLIFSRESQHNMEMTEPTMAYTHLMMNDNALPFMQTVCPNIEYSGCTEYITFSDLTSFINTDTTDQQSAFRKIMDFKNSDFWCTDYTTFTSMTADILSENPNAFSVLTIENKDDSDLYQSDIVATEFYAISGDAFGILHGNTNYVTMPISELLNGDTSLYAATGDIGNVYYNVTDSDVELLLQKLKVEIERREYIDNIDTIHIGDCVSKRGIMSAYGRYNDTNKVLSISLFTFTNKDVLTNNFDITIPFSPFEFTDEDNRLGKHSFKLVCSETRAYIAFTCNLPDDDFVITNAINAGVDAVGSTTFGQIKDRCGDSIVTILAFDISSDIVELPNEHKYLLKNVDIGYIPQFGGISGKNMVFTNSSLSGDERFPFDAQFHQLEDDANVRIYETFEKKLTEEDSNTVEFSKFVDLHRNGYTDGVFIKSDNKHGYYIPDFINDSESAIEFSNIDGMSLLDISNTTSSYKLIADGKEDEAYIGALSFNGSTVDVKRIPLFATAADYIATDFKSFYECGDDILAFHTSGDKISKLTINETDENLFSYGFVNYDENTALTNKNTAVGIEIYRDGNESISYSALDKVGFVKTTTTTVHIDSDDNFEHDIYENPTIVLTFLGAYSSGSIMQKSIEFNTTDDIKCVIPFAKNNIPYVLFYDKSELEHDFYKVSRLQEDGSIDLIDVDASFSILSNHHYITEVLNTKYDDVKLLLTDSLRVFMFNQSSSNTINYTNTFDDLVRNGEIDGSEYTLDKFTLCGGRGYGNVFIAYHSKELDMGGLLYVRHDTPNSIGIKSTFDIADVKHITKIVSYNTRILVEEEYNGSTRFHLSEDDGKTFRFIESLSNKDSHIIGCFANRFAVQYENGLIVTSINGIDWVANNTLVFSDWNAVNADGNSYAVCKNENDNTINDDENILSKCVKIEKQYTLDDVYDGIVVDENETIIAYGNIDGAKPLVISRIFKDSDIIEHFSFPTIRGSIYSGCGVYQNSLFLAPNGGTNVIKIDSIFSKTFNGSFRAIDISNLLGTSYATFRGFVVMNDMLLMYPSNGNKILVYNDGDNQFYNYTSLYRAYSFIDGDYIKSNDTGTVIFTESTSLKNSANGVMLASVNRKDFGIVEIDEGFPILVTYVKNYSNNTFEFTFTLLNDKYHNVVTIATYPDSADEDNKSIYREKTERSINYTVGNKSIVYKFSAVDNSTKYVISKNTAINDNADEFSQYLEISFYLNDRNRDNIWISYSAKDKTRYSIYDGFTEGELTAEDVYQRDIPSTGTGYGSLNISLFSTFNFTDSVSLSGIFNSLAIENKREVIDGVEVVHNIKDLVKNSNLMFTEHSSVKNPVECFANCKNARFDRDMKVTDKNMSIVSSMFANCTNALLPSVDLSESNISIADRMFQNCVNATLNEVSLPVSLSNASAMFSGCRSANIYEIDLSKTAITNSNSMFNDCVNATLEGVTVPPNTTNATRMFRNCLNAKLDTVTGIGNATECREMFYGCENAEFKYFKFDEVTDYAKTYDCNYMFYNCYGLNSKNLAFENISPYVRSSDYMFYGIGKTNKDIFNMTLYKFMKLESADGMFENSNLAFDGTVFQFFGTNGYINDETAILRSCTIPSIHGFFRGDTRLSLNAPRIVLSDNNNITIDNVDNEIDYALTGHYTTLLNNYKTGIIDFGELYSNTDINTADIRGICNNTDLQSIFLNNSVLGCQKLDSMFEKCYRLNTLVGYIPPYALSCRAMFKNCFNFSADISELFRLHNSDFTTTNDAQKAFSVDETGHIIENAFYNMLDISYMFYGCKKIFTYDDNFDLALIAEKGYNAHLLANTTLSESDLEYAFGFTSPIAMKTTLDDLSTAIYDIDNVSKNGLAIHYGTAIDVTERYSENSDITKWLFKAGYRRYGGQIPSDLNKHFSVLYYPTLDSNGNILSLSPKHTHVDGLSPFGFSREFGSGTISPKLKNATDSYWTFQYDDVYAAEVVDTTTGKKEYAYVGEYTAVYNYSIPHWYPSCGKWSHTHHYVYWYEKKRAYYKMPVTIFKGKTETIRPI